MSGLADRTVLVTRPREQAAALCSLLRERGAIPVVFPTIAVSAADTPDLEAALRGLDRFDWVVVTSANGVRFLADRLAALRCDRLPPTVRVAAVGSATARAAADRGLPVHAVPEQFTGTALPAAMGTLSGRAVLLPHGDIAREATAAALRAAGASVTDVVLYRTVAADPDAEAWRALEAGVDAITFTSPSAVQSFVALLAHRVRGRPDHAVIACIGGTTSAAARTLGFTVHVQPETATVEALVHALDTHFATVMVP